MYALIRNRMSAGCSPYERQYRVKPGGTYGCKVSNALREGFMPGFESIHEGTIINLVEFCPHLRVNSVYYGPYYKGWISTPDNERVYYYIRARNKIDDLKFEGKIVKRADDQYNYEGGRRTRNKRKSRKHRGRSRRSRRSRR